MNYYIDKKLTKIIGEGVDGSVFRQSREIQGALRNLDEAFIFFDCQTCPQINLEDSIKEKQYFFCVFSDDLPDDFFHQFNLKNFNIMNHKCLNKTHLIKVIGTLKKFNKKSLTAFFISDSNYDEINYVAKNLKLFLEFNISNISDVDLFKFNVVLRELMTNAIKHGNNFSDNKKVFISCFIKDNYLNLIVEDEGEGFNLPEIPENMNDLREEKRGFFIISNYSERITKNGNNVRIEMKL